MDDVWREYVANAYITAEYLNQFIPYRIAISPDRLERNIKLDSRCHWEKLDFYFGSDDLIESDKFLLEYVLATCKQSFNKLQTDDKGKIRDFISGSENQCRKVLFNSPSITLGKNLTVYLYAYRASCRLRNYLREKGIEKEEAVAVVICYSGAAANSAIAASIDLPIILLEAHSTPTDKYRNLRKKIVEWRVESGISYTPLNLSWENFEKYLGKKKVIVLDEQTASYRTMSTVCNILENKAEKVFPVVWTKSVREYLASIKPTERKRVASFEELLTESELEGIKSERFDKYEYFEEIMDL